MLLLIPASQYISTLRSRSAGQLQSGARLRVRECALTVCLWSSVHLTHSVAIAINLPHPFLAH